MGEVTPGTELLLFSGISHTEDTKQFQAFISHLPCSFPNLLNILRVVSPFQRAAAHDVCRAIADHLFSAWPFSYQWKGRKLKRQQKNTDIVKIPATFLNPLTSGLLCLTTILH